jgi:hypothetical protein
MLARLRVPAFAFCVLLSACGNDATAPDAADPTSLTLSVDSRVYLRLTSTGAETVNVSDPGSSTAWDLAIEKTSISLNGGTAGPGDVSGACLCRNQGLSTGDLLAIGRNSAPQRAWFDSVTRTNQPADSLFQRDRYRNAIGSFVRGATGTSAVAEPDSAWLLRWGTIGSPLRYGKMRVRSLTGATAAAPGSVTIDYSVQPRADTAQFPPVRSLTVPVTPGAIVYVDLDSNRVVTENADWDVAFDRWTLRVNGGAGGTGTVRALRFGPGTNRSSSSFDAANLLFAQVAPTFVWQVDTFEGIFGARPWYRYDPAVFQVYPTFDVYVIRRGANVWKLQPVGYTTDASGNNRRITVRAQPIAP